jgi:hypothetical protein
MSAEAGTSPILGLMGFWMMMGLVSTLALVLGGLYTLYCLARCASSMDRLAAAMEELAQHRPGPAAEIPTRSSLPPMPAPIAAPSVVSASSTTPYNTATGENAIGVPPSAGSSPVGGTNVERQSDEYLR